MEYKLYKVRWFLVFVSWLAVFTHDFSSTGYGIVNNIVARYFNVSTTSIDSLATITYVSGAIALVVTVLFHTQIGVRAQCITVSFCGLLGAASVMIGFLHRDLYWVILVGQILIGISGEMCFVTPVLLASNWFAPEEVGTSIAIVMSAVYIGQITSSSLFPLIFNDDTKVQHEEQYINKVKNVFITTYGVISLFLLIATMLVYIFAKDHPPSPPSAAHEINVAGNSETKTAKQNDVLKILKETVSNYRNVDFVLITAALSLLSSYFAVTKILIAPMLRYSFPNIPQSIPGMVRGIGIALAAIAFLLAGPLLDRIRRYKLFSVLSFIGLIPCCIAILLGHHFKWLLVLEILYPILMALHGFSEITLIEYLTHVSYPAERITLMSAHYFPTLIFYGVFIAVERIILNSFGATMTILLPLVACVVAFALILFVTSRFTRHDVNKDAGSTPLLSKK